MIDQYVSLWLIVGMLKHTTSHTWSRTDVCRTDSGLCAIHIRILITGFYANHRRNSSMHTCIHCIIEYIFNRTKLPLFSGISENWMPCLPFCTSRDWRKFPQISLWIHTLQTFSTHTLSVPSIIRHIHTVRPLVLPLCITMLDNSAEWVV